MEADTWDERYRAEPHPWGPQPAATIRARLEDATPGYAIDLGCGDGRHARWLYSRGWQVTAVDFSRVALEAARAKEYGSDIDWQLGDVTTWRPQRLGVDLVLVGFLQIDVDRLGSALRRAGGWLGEGGRLLYLGHARENHERGVGGPPNPRVLPGVADLALAAEGLRVDSLHHVLRDTGNGTAIDVVLDARTW
ncbi:methyltransferase family protein [Saccharomonospora marina XMU15]|uniref:Methyltransferase family protein n=1 Tax=Saccharomonospora marina XMU15 TaxID=882083 RepID=H5X108_9PSEU|nr:class I SAM-dependent methyltransferase [Saccharomonospora marina]EHR53067.1 methyltransferase family protein [Saccharomonospora marina XMU15]